MRKLICPMCQERERDIVFHDGRIGGYCRICKNQYQRNYRLKLKKKSESFWIRILDKIKEIL